MLSINIISCEFIADVAEGTVPSDETLKAYRDALHAEPSPASIEPYAELFPTKLIRAINTLSISGTEFTDEFLTKVLERIAVNLGPVNVPFYLEYFKASRIHSNAAIDASVRAAALESCLEHEPIGNIFFEVDIYNKLSSMYVEDPAANIEKIRLILPKIKAAIATRDSLPVSFLG